MLGLVFVLVASQTLAVQLLLDRPRHRALGLSLLLCLGLPAGLNTWFWIQRPTGSLTVAALGWTWTWPDNPGRKDPAGLVNARYLPMLRRAGADGARLAVSPEVGLWLEPAQKGGLFDALRGEAARTGTALAVGFFDAAQNDNRLLWIDPAGGVVGEYRKTHLIPFVENYRAGDGTLLAWTLAAPGGEAGGLRLGGMICQDDNFTDLARGYGRERVQVMALPTNDWKQVKDYHLENSVFRAVENRYGLVRAASNGTSAIVTARGEIMATLDPFTEGAGLIVAKLPVFEGGSLYALWGDWPILTLALGLLLAGALFWFLVRRPVRGGEDPPA
jgi:apolipoprotein N-acyltransferase